MKHIKSTNFILFIATVNFGYSIGFRVLCIITSVWENKKKIVERLPCSNEVCICKTGVLCNLCFCALNYLHLMLFQYTMKIIEKWREPVAFLTLPSIYAWVCVMLERFPLIYPFSPCASVLFCCSKSVMREIRECITVLSA